MLERIYDDVRTMVSYYLNRWAILCMRVRWDRRL